jgi:hypothetical protein
MATLVDSNIILDVATEDPAWASWSGEALADAADRGELLINPLIYAEVSIGYTSIEDLDDKLSPDVFKREPLPYEAGSSPARHSLLIADGAGAVRRRFQISTSAPMPPSVVIIC